MNARESMEQLRGIVEGLPAEARGTKGIAAVVGALEAVMEAVLDELPGPLEGTDAERAELSRALDELQEAMGDLRRAIGEALG